MPKQIFSSVRVQNKRKKNNKISSPPNSGKCIQRHILSMVLDSCVRQDGNWAFSYTDMRNMLKIVQKLYKPNHLKYNRDTYTWAAALYVLRNAEKYGKMDKSTVATLFMVGCTTASKFADDFGPNYDDVRVFFESFSKLDLCPLSSKNYNMWERKLLQGLNYDARWTLQDVSDLRNIACAVAQF